MVKLTLPRFLLALQLLAASCLAPLPVFALSLNGGASEATCPVAGSSVEVFYAYPLRRSWVIANTSDADVRVGFLPDPSTANLTGANSLILKPGASLSDTGPDLFVGRVVCMSTTAVAKVVGVALSWK